MRAAESAVEALEQRRLLTTASIVSNVLAVVGTSNPELIEIYQKSSNAKVTVYSGGSSLGEFAVANFTSSRIDSGGGGDEIWLGSTEHGTGTGYSSAFDTPATKPATLNGEAGSDTITGGDGNDTIGGGSDNDWLYGSAGNETIYGRRDDDHLFGESANNVLRGDGPGDEYGGADTLNGGTQDDHCYGRAGDDDVDGGAGNDWAWDDDPTDGTVAGYDTLRNGGGGADYFRGGFGDGLALSLRSPSSAPVR